MAHSQSDAQALFERGHAALEADDYHEAIECFTRAIALRPTVAAGYRYRAYARLGLKDRARALADFDQAIKLKPDDPQLRVERAAELLKQRHYNAAIADCEAAMRLDPGRADVYSIRAQCHAAAGDSEKAAADFAQAIAMDPDHAPHYLTERSRLRFDCGQYTAAVADADAALQIDPEYTAALEARALARQQLNDLDGAAADFHEAARLNPTSIVALFGYALVVFQQMRWADTIAAADALLAVKPGFLRVLEIRGVARKELGDFAGALADFEAVIVTDPNRPTGYMLRGDLYSARGDYAAAVHDHLEALKRAPRDAGTFNQLAWLWATAPDPDIRNGARAKECATRACELTDWANPAYLDTLAAACAECGEFDTATTWAEKALALAEPTEVDAIRQRLQGYRRGQPYRDERPTVL
jgi:tetratricopeptide (TPR) repeat protein